ncbi:MAG TPA: formate dehydrogenase accessory sulfurtransferase FdhD [Myxococcota bacterium]|nr:formate dehydrogenase accessory sulfurtransferase FdhD [Myxococcota bacterium]
MTDRKKPKSYQALVCKKGVCSSVSLDLIGEEPLMIRVEDKAYSVVMRSPGQEVFHAAGFCMGEGIVDSADDFASIGYDEMQDPNLVDVWLKPERRKEVRDILKRRGFVSQTSCGICGKELIEDLAQKLTPVESDFEIDFDSARECLEQLDKQQRYYQTTRASHAALILDERAQPLSFAEDVGRHNALDKAVGAALMDGKLSAGRIVVLSSRNSYELVQKAARARLPVMISNSRPTGLAVEMGKSLDMTLLFAGGSDLIVVCGESRIKGA